MLYQKIFWGGFISGGIGIAGGCVSIFASANPKTLQQKIAELDARIGELAGTEIR
jgi:hypothetical protein